MPGACTRGNVRGRNIGLKLQQLQLHFQQIAFADIPGLKSFVTDSDRFLIAIQRLTLRNSRLDSASNTLMNCCATEKVSVRSVSATW